MNQYILDFKSVTQEAIKPIKDELLTSKQQVNQLKKQLKLKDDDIYIPANKDLKDSNQNLNIEFSPVTRYNRDKKLRSSLLNNNDSLDDNPHNSNIRPEETISTFIDMPNFISPKINNNENPQKFDMSGRAGQFFEQIRHQRVNTEGCDRYGLLTDRNLNFRNQDANHDDDYDDYYCYTQNHKKKYSGNMNEYKYKLEEFHKLHINNLTNEVNNLKQELQAQKFSMQDLELKNRRLQQKLED